HRLCIRIKLCDLNAAGAVAKKEVSQFLTEAQNNPPRFRVCLDASPFLPILGFNEVKSKCPELVEPVETRLDYELVTGEAGKVRGLDPMTVQEISFTRKKVLGSLGRSFGLRQRKKAVN